jgi:hypothetical protein
MANVLISFLILLKKYLKSTSRSDRDQSDYLVDVLSLPTIVHVYIMRRCVEKICKVSLESAAEVWKKTIFRGVIGTPGSGSSGQQSRVFVRQRLAIPFPQP